MDRRDFLLMTGTSSVLTVTGCIEPLSEKSLSSPEKEDKEDETNLIFKRQGKRFLVVSVQYIEGYIREVNQIPIKITFWHEDDTHIDSISLNLRSPPKEGGVPARIFMKTPDGNPFPNIKFQKDKNDLSTIVSIGNIGEIGDGSITLEFIVEPLNKEKLIQLVFDTTVKLSDKGLLGGSYVGSGQAVMEIGQK